MRDPRVAAIVHEQALESRPVVLYDADTEQRIPDVPDYRALSLSAALAAFPRQISDLRDRALLVLARESVTLGKWLEFKFTQLAPFFATSAEEQSFIADALVAMKWLARANQVGAVKCRLEPAGWNRVAELQSGRNRSPRNPAFVAMWYGDGKLPAADESSSTYMTGLYEQAIKAAVERAGYKCDRVDTVQHSDWVMDKIKGMIRAAPFVVADFTGNRGGVYFEAGFARGLGLEVIHTCRESDFDKGHFDIKQINTIIWNRPCDLAEKLYHRIRDRLGDGPYPAPADAPVSAAAVAPTSG